MKGTRPDIPLVVVGCDFRSAPTVFRERLVSAPEDRERLFQSIRRIDADAGLVVLQTCNRFEWIVSTENPAWMAEILLAQMSAAWHTAFPGLPEYPLPAVYLGEKAALHLLRVAVGLESLATGESQIAGQFQSALQDALAEKTSSMVLNRLGSCAGRLAKIGYRIGFRSSQRKGIHGLTVQFLKRHFADAGSCRRVLVAGMGKIGRRTAQTMEEEGGFTVLRINRSIPEGSTDWHPLERLPELSREADAMVAATGALTPVFRAGHLDLGSRTQPLLIMDIGIPGQVDPELREHPGVLYRNIDHLMDLDQDGVDGVVEKRLEEELVAELELFRRFCRERDMVYLLEKIHQGRQEVLRNRLTPFLEASTIKNNPYGLQYL